MAAHQTHVTWKAPPKSLHGIAITLGKYFGLMISFPPTFSNITANVQIQGIQTGRLQQQLGKYHNNECKHRWWQSCMKGWWFLKLCYVPPNAGGFWCFFHPWVQLLHQLPSLAKFGIQTQPMRRIALHLGQRCTALTFQYPILYRPPVIFFPRSKSMQIPLLWLNLSRSSNPGMSHRVIWGAFPFLDYHQARF